MWNVLSARCLVLSGAVCAYCIHMLVWLVLLGETIFPDLGKVYMGGHAAEMICVTLGMTNHVRLCCSTTLFSLNAYALLTPWCSYPKSGVVRAYYLPRDYPLPGVVRAYYLPRDTRAAPKAAAEHWAVLSAEAAVVVS